MEVKKKDDWNDQAQIGGRVLSSVSEGADKIFDAGEALKLTIENKEAELIAQQECDLDCNTSKSENVGFVENGSKMHSLSSGDNIGGVDTEMEVKKKVYLTDKVQIGGRVLRSTSKRAISKISRDGEVLNLSTENKEVEPIIQQPCDLDWDVSNSGNVGLAETGIKRNGLRSDVYFEGLDINMELKKKNNADDKVKFSGRVLRSMSKSVDDKIFHGGEIDEVLVGKSRDNEHHWFEKNNLKVEKEEGNDFVCSGYEKEGVHVKKDGNDGREMRRKRGRPPKLKMEEQDQLVGNLQQKCGQPPRLKMEKQDQLVGNMQLKCGQPSKFKMEEQDQLVGVMQRKRGRPPKLKMEEQDQLVGNMQCRRGRPPKMKMEEQDQFLGEKIPRKRGRPPKVEQKINNLEAAHGRKGKVGFQKVKKHLTMRDDTNMNVADDMCSKRGLLKKKRFSPIKSEFGNSLKTETSALASPLITNSVKSTITNKNERSKTKQLVRQHIWELLLAAGWTVDYRPRNGRDYNDSVYVSPDGKTHWSITLAYKRLQKHSEAGDGEGKVYMPGFKFVPIPMEEFNILTKVMTKKRKSKGKKKQTGGKDGDSIDGIKRKGKKEQLFSFGGSNKLLREKMKRKMSLVEEDNLDVTSYKRFPLLVKDRKRQKTHNKKRSVFMVRNAEEIDSELNGYALYTGKRTVLSWMIDLGTVVQNEKVHYVNPRRRGAKLEGRIMGDGIHCDCCNEIVTISEFEAHAGSRLSEPLRNIHTEGGISLLQCMLDSWNKQDESERKGFHFIDTTSEDPNDDACGVCGDGGDLICCDSCPSTFHQSCLNIRKSPPGNWHCIYCCCKFCELVDESANERDGYNDSTTSALLTCRLCDQKYHRSCVEVKGLASDDSSFAFYCGSRCEELSKRLEMLLGVKHDIGDGISWTFIRRSDVGSDASQIESQMVECNSKLAVAVSVMDECFMPYIDHRSGTNLIHSILYNCGSNFNRLNYSGFITAILERNDEVICAASIRIRGNQLAEMPFIGTRYMYRRQGMCHRLLSAIESALSSLNVELLVIPAVSELRETWTSVFGFEPLEVNRKQMIKNFNLLVFPHVDMLLKEIKKPKVAEDPIPVEVSNPERQKNQAMHEEATDFNEPGLFRSDLIISAGVGIRALDICPIDDRHISIESGSHNGLLNNPHSITSETILPDTSPEDVKCEVVCHAVCDKLTVEGITAVYAHDYISGAHSLVEEMSNLDCVQSHPMGSKEINSEYTNGRGSQGRPNGYCGPDEVNFKTIKADESNVCASKAANLQSLVDSGDCQSMQLASGSCVDIVANGVNETGKAASTADRDSDFNDMPGMNQTAPSKAPLLCGSSNSGSGMALHCASAGGTSCGNTEIIVLSNEASWGT